MTKLISRVIRALFPGKTYITLEDPDNRLLALNDPRGFLDESARS